MDAKFYMEYRESRKVIEEVFEAQLKYKNTKKWGMFKSSNIHEKAIQKAEERYKDIRLVCRKERTIKVEFFEDHFVCTTDDMSKKYRYDEIEEIFETDTILAFVADKNRKKDSFVGLKKGSIRGRSLADLKQFVVKRCTKATKGIEKL